MVVIRYVGLLFLLRPRGEHSWIVETEFPKLMRAFLKLMSFVGVLLMEEILHHLGSLNYCNS